MTKTHILCLYMPTLTFETHDHAYYFRDHNRQQLQQYNYNTRIDHALSQHVVWHKNVTRFEPMTCVWCIHTANSKAIPKLRSLGRPRFLLLFHSPRLLINIMFSILHSHCCKNAKITAISGFILEAFSVSWNGKVRLETAIWEVTVTMQLAYS